MRRHRLEILSVEFRQSAHVCIAQAMRLFQDRLKDRQGITLRLVDHSQNFSQRRLSHLRRVALGTIFVELLLQCRVGALQIGDSAVTGDTHWPTSTCAGARA